MTTVFKINKSASLSKFMSGRTFKDDEEFLEFLEDYLFGKIIEKSDVGDYVSEEKVLKILNTGKNIF